MIISPIAHYMLHLQEAMTKTEPICSPFTVTSLGRMRKGSGRRVSAEKHKRYLLSEEYEMADGLLLHPVYPVNCHNSFLPVEKRGSGRRKVLG